MPPVSKPVDIRTPVTKLPAIPQPRAGNVQEVLGALKQTIEVLIGSRGQAADAAVTWRDIGGQVAADLIGSGLVDNGVEIPGPATEERIDMPTAPTNVRATGGYGVIFLEWDRPSFSGFLKAEVFMHTANDFGAKAKVGDGGQWMYVHQEPSTATRHFWVRFVNKRGDIGPFQGTNGIAGTTALNPGYMNALVDGAFAGTTPIDMKLHADRFFLAAPGGALSQAPFKVVATPYTAANGVPVPVGVYMKSALIEAASIGTAAIGTAAITRALIADAAINEAKIENLAVTNAKIANAAIDTAQIRDLAVNSAKISSLAANKITTGTLQANAEITGGNWYASGGAQGWRIGAEGGAHFNSVVVRGLVQASTVDASTIQGSVINGTTINGSNIFGGSFVGNYYRSDVLMNYVPPSVPGLGVRAGALQTWTNWLDFTPGAGQVAGLAGNKFRVYSDGRVECEDLHTYTDHVKAKGIWAPGPVLASWRRESVNREGYMDFAGAFEIDCGFQDPAYDVNNHRQNSYTARVRAEGFNVGPPQSGAGEGARIHVVATPMFTTITNANGSLRGHHMFIYCRVLVQVPNAFINAVDLFSVSWQLKGSN